jgi:hypothetical protein
MYDIKEICEYALYGFLITYGTWLFYLALMNVKRAKDAGKITRVVYVLGYPLLLVGLILDFLCNMLVFTVIMIEIPQELLVTTRLSRHICNDTWRGKIAKWFCVNLLDQFDPSGKHCKCKHE